MRVLYRALRGRNQTSPTAERLVTLGYPNCMLGSLSAKHFFLKVIWEILGEISDTNKKYRTPGSFNSYTFTFPPSEGCELPSSKYKVWNCLWVGFHDRNGHLWHSATGHSTVVGKPDVVLLRISFFEDNKGSPRTQKQTASWKNQMCPVWIMWGLVKILGSSNGHS